MTKPVQTPVGSAPATPGHGQVVPATHSTIDAGGSHTCALAAEGRVLCWGGNEHGQLGDGTTTNRRSPVEVKGLPGRAVAVTAGSMHTCALTSTGTVACWGDNKYGALGDGSTATRLSPVIVKGLDARVTAISAGGSYTCALSSTGGARCWGYNGEGELGDGTLAHRLAPVDVQGLTGGVVALTAGWEHTCALTGDGSARCWGNNRFGELGDGTAIARPTPVQVQGVTRAVTDIAVGKGFTCALSSAGGVECWGSNVEGQLGDDSTNDSLVPIAVHGLASGFTAISAGWQSTCAVTDGGGAVCWGVNELGELGDGTGLGRRTPVAVKGLSRGVASVSVGIYHGCARNDAGGVRCWGSNSQGQLGHGRSDVSLSPVAVDGLPA